MGDIWQFLRLAGQSGTAVGVNEPIKAIKDDGVLGYLNCENTSHRRASIELMKLQ
jgi:hypothetical protein